MQIRLLGILICFFCLGFSSSSSAENQYAVNSVLYHIENDYLNGNISLDDKVILQVNSIKFPQKIDSKYQSTSIVKTELELRGATLALLQIRIGWEELTQESKNYLSLALARISTQFTYISPNGYFKIHYDTSGINAVSPLDLDLDLIPDFVEKCASYCDTSLAKHLEQGYAYPPNDGVAGGDTLYDVYFQDMENYGYAQPEGVGSNPWNDYYSYLVLNRDFIGFPDNTDPEGDIAGAAKATVAHEFHHAVQFGYDATEEGWVLESGATYFEEVVFDLVNDNYNYIDDYLDFPHTSLMDNSGNHKYGAFLWPLYLAQNFDTLINLSAWEAARYDNIFDAYADTLLDKYGWDIDSAFVDFTYWLFNTGLQSDGNHFTEGADYYPLAISASHISYPIPITNSPVSVGGYGAGYITFFPGSEIGKLQLTFNGSNTRNWSAYVIKSSSQNVHEIEYITLDPIEENGEIIIEGFESYYSVTLVGVNVDEFTSSVLYTYKAEIVLPYEVSSIISGPPDPFLYSGGDRTYEILVRNDAVINDIFNLIYWDEDGWLPIDTFAFAVDALDSVIVPVVVSPPEGTPIGVTSLLTFKTESWGNSEIFDQISRTGHISLYRGDTDFSGEIDISDLIALINYMFNGGSTPLPVELSADFNCSNVVDISDLILLINYMFDGGAKSPCNPY